jgi:hypothetical protein
MYRPSSLITLKDQHRWSLAELRIVLHENRIRKSVDDIANSDAFVCEFIVFVLGDSNVSRRYEVTNPQQRVDSDAPQRLARAAQ